MSKLVVLEVEVPTKSGKRLQPCKLRSDSVKLKWKKLKENLKEAKKFLIKAAATRKKYKRK